MAEKIVRDGTGRLFRTLEREDDNLSHCWLAYLGERLTLEGAEHLARHHVARRGVVASIMHEIADRPATRRKIARVSRDALGRLWTDIHVMGAVL